MNLLTETFIVVAIAIPLVVSHAVASAKQPTNPSVALIRYLKLVDQCGGRFIEGSELQTDHPIEFEQALVARYLDEPSNPWMIGCQLTRKGHRAIGQNLALSVTERIDQRVLAAWNWLGTRQL